MNLKQQEKVVALEGCEEKERLGMMSGRSVLIQKVKKSEVIKGTH